jgi:selenocysteine lyase/cysteine desulfurase
VLSDRTRLVAVTGASNLIGTMPDVSAISAASHDAGALVFVDGVHLTAHELPDVEQLGADFFTCSPYKFLGPHCGVLAARPDLLETIAPDKLLPATNVVPERFEFGTLPYEVLAGVTAAVDVLASLDPDAAARAESRRERLAASYTVLRKHEEGLRARLEEGLAALPGISIRSRASRRTPTLLATFEGHAASEVTKALAAGKVLAPSGNFYALEASRHLGLGDAGGLRMGIAPYTDADDVDRLLAGLAAALGS